MKKLILGVGLLALSACGTQDASIQSGFFGSDGTAPIANVGGYSDTLALKRGIYKLAGQVNGLRTSALHATASVTLYANNNKLNTIVKNGAYTTNSFDLTSGEPEIKVVSNDEDVNCYAIKRYDKTEAEVNNDEIPIDIQCVCATAGGDPASVITQPTDLKNGKTVVFENYELTVPVSYGTSTGGASYRGIDGSTEVELTASRRAAFSKEFFEGIMLGMCNCAQELSPSLDDAPYKVLSYGSSKLFNNSSYQKPLQRMGLYAMDALGDYKEVVKAEYRYENVIGVWDIFRTIRKEGTRETPVVTPPVEEIIPETTPEVPVTPSTKQEKFGDYTLEIPAGMNVGIDNSELHIYESPYNRVFHSDLLCLACSSLRNLTPVSLVANGLAEYVMGLDEVSEVVNGRVTGKRIMKAKIFHLSDGERYKEMIHATFDIGSEAQAEAILKTIQKKIS